MFSEESYDSLPCVAASFHVSLQSQTEFTYITMTYQLLKSRKIELRKVQQHARQLSDAPHYDQHRGSVLHPRRDMTQVFPDAPQRLSFRLPLAIDCDTRQALGTWHLWRPALRVQSAIHNRKVTRKSVQYEAHTKRLRCY